MDRRGAFDYILLETTGLADPGNIAPLFWVDEGLGSTIYLDGIVTLVDAKNALRCLDEPTEEETVGHGEDVDGHHHGDGTLLSTAHLQISHADVVVVNKVDLVTPRDLKAVEERVRSINALAKVQFTNHSQVPQLEGLVLDLHAYDKVSAESLTFASKGHSHLDPAIGTVTLAFPPLDDHQLDKLDEWLRSVLWDNKLPEIDTLPKWEVHRIKGRIPLVSGKMKLLQGVREIFELIDAANAGSDTASAAESGKIVIIGRNISSDKTSAAFQKSLESCLASGPKQRLSMAPI